MLLVEKILKALSYINRNGFKCFLQRMYQLLAPYIKSFICSSPFYDVSKKNTVCKSSSTNKILFFSGIEWEYRFQRQQQLTLALAKNGQDVIYCDPQFYKIYFDKNLQYIVEDVKQNRLVKKTHFFSNKIIHIDKIIDDENAFVNVNNNINSFIEKCTTNTCKIICIVQHPIWWCALKSIKNVKIIYDCIDDVSDFTNGHHAIAQIEADIIQSADAITCTAQGLYQKCKEKNKKTYLLRNACDFEYFSHRPKKCFDPVGKKVIGYHGAIEDWFDDELIAELAVRFTEDLIVLVGNPKKEIADKLSQYKNILLIGEVPFSKLTFYLYSFDVAILPFKIKSLTLNTNPVKIYEYLAVGLPVVVVDIPEMQQFCGLVEISQRACFADAVEQQLKNTSQQKEARRAFASMNTWNERGKELVSICENTK